VGGPVNDSITKAMWLGTITKVVVAGTYLGPGANSAYFSFRAARAGTEQIVATGLTITILNSRGRRVMVGSGVLNLKVTRGSLETVMISTSTGQEVPGYTLSIGPKTNLPAARPARALALTTATTNHVAAIQTAHKAAIAIPGAGERTLPIQRTRKHLKP
jgi:hypothetical protein